MKKYLAIISASILVLTLSACARGGSLNDSDNENITPESHGNSSAVSSNVSENSEEENINIDKETFLVGLDKQPLYSSEITALYDKNGSALSAGDLTKENFGEAVCEGICYLAEPTGYVRNNKDNADVYTGDFMREFSDLPEGSRDYHPVFKKLKVGDTIGGLTLKSARTVFDRWYYDWEYETFDADGYVNGTKPLKDLDIPEIFFKGSTAEFDGEITLNGYIQILTDKAGYGTMGGEIVFVPTESVLPGSAPLFYTASPNEDPQEVTGFYNIFRMVCIDNAGGAMPDENSTIVLNEYGEIFLGNISDTTTDMSEIKKGEYTKVRATLGNIKYDYGSGDHDNGDGVSGEITASLIAVEKID